MNDNLHRLDPADCNEIMRNWTLSFKNLGREARIKAAELADKAGYPGIRNHAPMYMQFKVEIDKCMAEAKRWEQLSEEADRGFFLLSYSDPCSSTWARAHGPQVNVLTQESRVRFESASIPDPVKKNFSASDLDRMPAHPARTGAEAANAGTKEAYRGDGGWSDRASPGAQPGTATGGQSRPDIAAEVKQGQGTGGWSPAASKAATEPAHS
jgi:hypothetical protein